MNAPTSMGIIAPPQTRNHYIGGSDIAAILGISPWASPVELWMQKRSANVDRYDDDILRRGRRLEPYIREWFTEETGVGVAPPAFVYGREPWIGGNLDGMTADGVFEAKSAHPSTRGDWGEPGGDTIPAYYTAQVQWYMMITGKDRAHVAALLGMDDFRRYLVIGDRDIQHALYEKARAFWLSLAEGTPPPIESERDARALFPVSIEEEAEATEEVALAVDALVNIKAAVKSHERAEAEAKKIIFTHMGAAECLTYRGATLATWKTQEAERIDVTGLRRNEPDIAAAYSVLSTSRVLRLK